MSYDEVMRYENLLRAGEKCCNGGRWKSRTQLFEIDILRQTSRNRKRLADGTFEFGKTHDFTIKERGKWREIKPYCIEDRQVQKSFCKHEMIPAAASRIMPNNSASQKNKGTDYMLKRFRADLAHAYRVCGGRGFYLFVYDFHNFFGSIPHGGCMGEAEEVMHDGRSVGLLQKYTDAFPGDTGYGIGGEPSQVIAVAYPASIDRMIACEPCVLGSGRYMDDGYAAVPTLEAARRVEGKFMRASAEKGLTVNEKRMQIYSMETDTVTFLKKRTSITESGRIVMRLTRENIREELHRIDCQKRECDAGRMPVEAALESLESWCSYAKKYDSYKARVRVLDYFSGIFGVPWEQVRALLW